MNELERWVRQFWHGLLHGKPERHAKYRAGQLSYVRVECPCGESWDEKP